MGGQRHSVDQPHVEARPAGLRSARLRPAELRMPQLRRPELQRQLSRGDGITSVFHGHTATPRPAAPHPLAALAALAADLLIRTIALLVQACQYHIVRADPWCLGRMLAEALPTCRGNGGE